MMEFRWKWNALRAILLCVTVPTVLSLAAQEPDSSAVQRVNLQTFTPSVLMRKGQWELKVFNNLYSQTAGFDDRGRREEFNGRGTYNTLLIQSLFGWKPRVSVGVDAWIRSVRLDASDSSPLDVFAVENSPQARTALSAIGPKVKLALFPKLPKLALQSTLLIPIATDQEGLANDRPFLATDSYLWLTQLFYDHAITKRVLVFAQVAPWVYYRTKPMEDGSSQFRVSTPATVFLTWFATDRLGVYLTQEYWPTWGETGVSAWFRQEGLGAKFQLIPGLLEVEASHTVFSNGRNSGAGKTYNFGVRMLH